MNETDKIRIIKILFDSETGYARYLECVVLNLGKVGKQSQ